MFSHRLRDPKVLRELQFLNIAGLLFGILIFVVIGGLHAWRLHSFARAVATVEAVRQEERSGRGGKFVVTIGDLSFTRVSSGGTSHACRHAFEIGRPDDQFEIGDKLEIVPATGTCERVDIIGRAGVSG